MIDLYALIVTVWACAATVGFLIMWALYRRAWWEGWLERIAYDREQLADIEKVINYHIPPVDVPGLVAYHTGGDTVADLRPSERAWNPDE